MSKYIVDNSGDRQAFTIETGEMTKLFEVVEANDNGLSVYRRLEDDTFWLSITSDTQTTMIPMTDSPHPL